MVLLTFDAILTQLCDDFDELISPKKMSRSNTNIVYLIFKALAKGWELINNICVVLSNKFDPTKCSTDDLESVAYLVGTERRKGSASGLKITVRNTGETEAVLSAGLYYYALNDDVKFEFEVLSDTAISAGSSVSYIAMSESIGQFPVTAQTEIAIDTEQTVPDGIVFDCGDNKALLGLEPESVLAFRKRILTDYDRQVTYIELEEKIRSQPYIFDCKVRFNPTDENMTVGDVTIPPFTGAIWYSGEAKNELAGIIADYFICPTVATQDSVEVKYETDVFTTGYFTANLIPFAKLDFTLDLIYSIDEEYQNKLSVVNDVKSRLMSAFTLEEYRPYILEEDIYFALASFNVAGFNVLAVNLKVNGSAVDYITVPPSKLARLTDVNPILVEG